MAGAIMIQGAGSNVGKSVIVAGLCRHFTNAGLVVRPFKPQNMSNNAAVTSDGGEIGRAQALQAMACRTPATVDMNPVLLKPESETGAQVIVRGKRRASMRAAEYTEYKASLLDEVLESFERLKSQADLVIVEGAGSPAEVNLRKGDIANMGFARAANVPVVLVGDIDRGGVIASLVGTHAVLDPEDREMIKGFLINKFRGDTALFADGMTAIEEATGWKGLGILPWFPDANKLPAEDILDLQHRHSPRKRDGKGKRGVHIAVPVLKRIANFDDLDPLANEPDVALTLVGEGEAIPGDADLVIIPGSKSTISDLAYLREQGWDIDIKAHVRRGGMVLGLCGGYQMLGKRIRDPSGVEGSACEAKGLDLLDVDTVLSKTKTLERVHAQSSVFKAVVDGYEIHMGKTSGSDCRRPFLNVAGCPEGASSSNGRIIGTYVHGIFTGDNFRRALLSNMTFQCEHEIDFGNESHEDGVNSVLSNLADYIERTVNIGCLTEFTKF